MNHRRNEYGNADAVILLFLVICVAVIIFGGLSK